MGQASHTGTSSRIMIGRKHREKTTNMGAAIDMNKFNRVLKKHADANNHSIQRLTKLVGPWGGKARRVVAFIQLCGRL